MANTRETIMAESGCGTQIAEDAVEHDYLPILLGDNGKPGDQSLRLYDCNGTQVIDTNGDAVWQDSTDHDDWYELLNQIGILDDD